MDSTGNSVALYSNDDPQSALSLAKTDSTTLALIARMETREKTEPSNVRLLTNLSSLYLAAGKLEKAEGAAKRALRFDVNNKDAPLLLAQIAYKRGQYDLANILLGNIGGERSERASVLNLMALVAMKKNEPSEALYLFKKSIEKDPKDLASRMNLGVAYLRYRQIQKASTQFERVLSVMPHHTDAKLHMAIVQASRGKNAEARVLYDEVLEVHPTNTAALYNLAVINKNEGKYDEAVDQVKAYLRASHNSGKPNDDAFAMIEEIQSRKAKDGEKEIDPATMAELKLLAKHSSPIKQEESQAKGPSTKEAVKEPAKQPEVKQETIESIDDLERALLH
jgi:cytochrome c-type biogenesis protein CcmH/NrfG